MRLGVAIQRAHARAAAGGATVPPDDELSMIRAPRDARFDANIAAGHWHHDLRPHVQVGTLSRCNGLGSRHRRVLCRDTRREPNDECQAKRDEQ